MIPWLLLGEADLPRPAAAGSPPPPTPASLAFSPVGTEHAGPGSGRSGVSAPAGHHPQVTVGAGLLQDKGHRVPSGALPQDLGARRGTAQPQSSAGTFPEPLPGFQGMLPLHVTRTDSPSIGSGRDRAGPF